MIRRLIARLEAALDPPRTPALAPLSWSEVEAVARRLPEKTNLIVPKSHVGSTPPYAVSRVGRPRGAVRQYRCARRRHNLHVKEYPGHWVVHVDQFNPYRHPFRHLFVDHGYKAFTHLWQLVAPPQPTPTPVPA